MLNDESKNYLKKVLIELYNANLEECAASDKTIDDMAISIGTRNAYLMVAQALDIPIKRSELREDVIMELLRNMQVNEDF